MSLSSNNSILKHCNTRIIHMYVYGAYVYKYFATLRLSNAFSKSKLNYSYATYAHPVLVYMCVYVH